MKEKEFIMAEKTNNMEDSYNNGVSNYETSISQDSNKSIESESSHNIEFCYRITDEMLESILNTIKNKRYTNRGSYGNINNVPLNFKKTNNDVSFRFGHVDKEKKMDKIYTEMELSSEDNESTIKVYKDPEHPNIKYLIGKGTGSNINGNKDRWVVFDSLYKIIKKAEMNKTLEKMSKDFGIDLGGKLVITNNMNSNRYFNNSSKDFQLGYYTPEYVDENEIEKIYNQFMRKSAIVKKMTIREEDREALLQGESEIPVIGLMGNNINNLEYDVENDERQEVGILSYQTILDPVNHKPHKVLELSISNSVTAPPESIVDFIKTVNKFTRNNDIDIEGVIPEENLIYGEDKEKKIIVLNSKNGNNFDCEMIDNVKSEVLLNEVSGNILNISPSPLFYREDGSFDSSDIYIDGMILKPRIDSDRSEATMSVYQASYFRRSIVEPCPNVDYANFVLELSNSVNMSIPNVDKFFENKKAKMLTMKSPITWVPGRLIVESGLDKADVWHIEAPVQDENKVQELFDYLSDIKKDGAQMPKELRFDKFFINGRLEKLTITREQLNTMFDAVSIAKERFTKEKDKDLEDSIDFPDF